LFSLQSTVAIPFCTGFLTSSWTNFNFSEQGGENGEEGKEIWTHHPTSDCLALASDKEPNRIQDSCFDIPVPPRIYLNSSHHIVHHLNKDLPHHLICYLSHDFASIHMALAPSAMHLQRSGISYRRYYGQPTPCHCLSPNSRSSF
jgi:hypothetical protein